MEQLAAQPEFWDDAEQAQTIMQDLNDLKSNVTQYGQWVDSLENAQTVVELLVEDDAIDESLMAEAVETLTRLDRELEQWEFQQMLSGEYDKGGAVLSINAGARWNGCSGLDGNAAADVYPLE